MANNSLCEFKLIFLDWVGINLPFMRVPRTFCSPLNVIFLLTRLKLHGINVSSIIARLLISFRLLCRLLSTSSELFFRESAPLRLAVIPLLFFLGKEALRISLDSLNVKLAYVIHSAAESFFPPLPPPPSRLFLFLHARELWPSLNSPSLASSVALALFPPSPFSVSIESLRTSVQLKISSSVEKEKKNL